MIEEKEMAGKLTQTKLIILPIELLAE